jgi:hypothetical protein
VVLCELLPCCVPTLRHSSCNGHSEEPSHDSHLLNTLKVISQFHQHGGRTVVPLVRTGVQMRGLLLFPCSEFYSHHKQKGEWRYENRLTLKTTPAMSAGVPNRRWEIQDLRCLFSRKYVGESEKQALVPLRRPSIQRLWPPATSSFVRFPGKTRISCVEDTMHAFSEIF